MTLNALPPELLSFAAIQIASLLGLPEEDAAEIAQSALGSSVSPAEVKQWCADFLGDSGLEFADEFSKRRFATAAKPKPAPTNHRPSSKPPPKQTQQPKYRPQEQQWTNLPGVRVVDRKNEVEEDFYKPKKQQGGNKPATPPLEPPKPAAPAPPANPAPPKPKPKQNKKAEEPKVIVNANRRPCPCLATRHPLLTNCLTCGRIVCSVEGPGPCFTCSAPVLSAQQQLERLASKMNKSALERAEENRDKMLQFQRESAQRTRIYDAAADFDPNAVATDRWASKEERERAVLKLKEEKKREEEKRRVRVINLDLEKMSISRGELAKEDSRPKKPVVPTNASYFADGDDGQTKLAAAATAAEDHDRGQRIRANPTLSAPPLFIPPSDGPPQPKQKKTPIWKKEKDSDKVSSTAAAPAPQLNRDRDIRKTRGGKWARVQHDFNAGGVDFELEDLDDLGEELGGREGTETACD